jgi:carbon monoxide dehydrogenase subunit G
MKITGAVSLSAEPKQVWDAIHDPAVLARTLPGCESLTELGPNRYQMSITAGIAAVRGTYDGTVSLEDLEAPTSLRMRASGAGAPGTIEADVAVTIEGCEDGGTRVTYNADAEVGGPIGGVGQRMLSGVTKKMAGQFFAALDADIAGVRPELRATAPTPVGARAAAPAAEVAAGEPRVYTGKAPAAGPSVDTGFALGVAVGGALALIGVAVGARIARRR